MVFWRSPSAYDFSYGLDTIFMGISPQNDESRPLTPSHGPEPEKVRIILLVGQTLKKLVGLSDVERVAVAQPPRFPVLLHLLLMSGKIHIPVLLLRLTAFSTVRLVVQIRVQRDKAHGLVAHFQRLLQNRVRREADIDRFDEAGLVILGRVGTLTPQCEAERAQVTQVHLVTLLQGQDNLFLKRGQYGQTVGAGYRTAGTDPFGQIVDVQLVKTYRCSIEFTGRFKITRVFAFDHFVDNHCLEILKVKHSCPPEDDTKLRHGQNRLDTNGH